MAGPVAALVLAHHELHAVRSPETRSTIQRASVSGDVHAGLNRRVAQPVLRVLPQLGPGAGLRAQDSSPLSCSARSAAARASVRSSSWPARTWSRECRVRPMR